MTRRVAVRALCLAAGWLLAAQVAVAAEPIPLMSFFRYPAISEAVLSPAGSHVAVLMPGGPYNRQRLLMIDLRNVTVSKVLAGFSDADIAGVHWVNDERLVYSLIDRQSAGRPRSGHEGLISVDRDGATAPRRLIKAQSTPNCHTRAAEFDRELSCLHQLFALPRDGSNEVVVVEYRYDPRGEPIGTLLHRVDTVTGRSRLVTDAAPGNAYAWALDASGTPRVAMTSKAGVSTLYWKPTADADSWVRERVFRNYVDEVPGLYRLGTDDRLLVAMRVDGSDTASLVRIDLKDAGKPPDPLVSVAGFDFEGSLDIGSQGRLLGVHYRSEALATHWFDPALQALQRRVDALLPSTNNLIDCGDCSQLSRVVVRAQSDRQPAVFYLFDSASGMLEPLAASRPWIEPRTMARRDFQRFKARDGLEIPVHVTRPPGVQGPAPAVVLVHGGPWLRGGEWRWDAESQFLASRGYVVVEPEFRGSTGYGSKLFRAGFKQWGLAMQDDIADAARWAVQQGYADPQRMAIAGAGYGGYATLMGLIRDPDLFRCGFEWVGVSDVDLMYSINSSNLPDDWKRYGMPALIGDRRKDAAQLAATSPLPQAARLKQPLLMAYGTEDYRVPLDHGSAMRDALRAHNPNVEFVTYTGEAHGWALESTQADFWGRVERFLAKNLAPRP